jgi:rod shape-determining protein MreC
MANGYKNRNNQSSLILHISRPVRNLIRRFSLGLLIFISLVSVIAVNSENSAVIAVRMKVVDSLSPVIEVISYPIEMFRGAGEYVKTYLFVHSKNEQLSVDNDKLRLRVIKLYQAKKENEKLKELLNYVTELDYEYITAKVVGNSSGPFSRSSLINAGESDGVIKDQAIIMNGGFIGRVIEVGNHSSRILLLTDINSKTPVISLNSRERSIISGNNTENPKLIYLPKDSKITDGEVMVTSGDGAMIPPGLIVGRAFKLSDGSYEVLPFVSWHNIEFVSILTLKKDNK